MTALTDYWLKANLFLVLFYGCYWLLLRRHTFLHLNRAYLLGTLLLSFALPLLHIPGLSAARLFELFRQPDAPVGTVTLDTGYVGAVVAEPEAPLLPEWPVLLTWAVVAGAGLLLLRTGWRTGRLLRQIRQWPAEPLGGYVAVYPPNPQTPTFSFFRYLVLNPADVLSTTIWQHEMGHIRQGHSIDVLLVELVQALCWPNPALWGYRRALRETHEFLADRYATHNAADSPAHSGGTATERDTYARFLVQYAFNLPADALTHPFSTKQANFPTLKQRIQMLYEQHTRPRALWKYALVLPLATALLAMTNAPESTADSATGELTLPAATATVNVEGVISGANSKPLRGATVSDKKGEFEATTDWKGQFQLNAPVGATLVIRASGYRDMDLTVEPDQTDLVVDYRLIPLAADAPKTLGDAASPATAPVRVSGVVRADDDKPLPGATIDVKGIERGTTTDADGRFQIDAPGGSRLIAKFAGFKSQEIPVSTNVSVLNVNVVLEPTSSTVSKVKPAAAPYSVSQQQQGQVFTVVQQLPRFPGGNAKLFQFLGRMLRYPAAAVRSNVGGKVFVAFIVNTNGQVDQIQVIKGIGFGCDEEAARVVALMPKWIPGKQNGRAVAVKYVLPIQFQLSEGKKVGMGSVRNPPKAGLSYAADSVELNRGMLTIMTPKALKINNLSNVLWFIDGKESTQASVEALSPDGIQSIDVVKGESAQAQYGQEGRYGVVRITTKNATKE